MDPYISDWLRAQKSSLDNIAYRYIIEDWLAISELIERGHGYSLMPQQIPISRTDIDCIDLPKKIVSGEIFYAVYHKAFSQFQVVDKIFS